MEPMWLRRSKPSLPGAEGAALVSKIMLDTLRDWLGDGGIPVDRSLAEKRLSICLHGNNGKLCPLNVEPKWWETALKNPIAEVIRAELELKNSMGLSLPDEESAGICKICGCCLILKPWTPIEHITKHLDERTLSKAPDFCWMKLESMSK